MNEDRTVIVYDKTKISSSWSRWPIRNINIWNDNGSFPFCVDCFFPLSPRRLLLDLPMPVSYMKQELLTLREHIGSPPCFRWGWCCSGSPPCFRWGWCCSWFWFLCVFVLFVCQILPVSHDCLFLIVPFVFSNVY